MADSSVVRKRQIPGKAGLVGCRELVSHRPPDAVDLDGKLLRLGKGPVERVDRVGCCLDVNVISGLKGEAAELPRRDKLSSLAADNIVRDDRRELDVMREGELSLCPVKKPGESVRHGYSFARRCFLIEGRCLYEDGAARNCPPCLQGSITRSHRKICSNFWSSYFATCLMMMSAGMETKMNQMKNWQIKRERPTTSTNGLIGMPNTHGGLVAPLKIGEAFISLSAVRQDLLHQQKGLRREAGERLHGGSGPGT